MAKKAARKVFDPLDEMEHDEAQDVQTATVPLPEVETPEPQPEVGEPSLPDGPEVEWVTIRVPIMRGRNVTAYAPRQVQTVVGMMHQREALRAMFQGMEGHCRVQQRSAIVSRGTPVSRFGHVMLCILDQVAEQMGLVDLND
jgi:hypothetical protein